MNITALILAGGQAQRMGQDKRLLKYHGKLLIHHTLQAAQAISDEVWVLIASQGDRQILAPLLGSDVRFLFDAHPGSGPLGALVSALPQVKGEYALLLAVDYPLIMGDFLQGMKRELEAQATLPDVFVPLWQETPQVTCALYRRTLYPELRESFIRGERSLRRWVTGLTMGKVQRLAESECKKWGGPHVFLNVNTQQDYQRLLELSQWQFEK